MIALSPLFGLLVGFSLGLTGGGGSIFAVPLLVYGLAIAPREAIGISLAAVGATALIGAIQRLRAGEVALRTGVFFALAGMLGAPFGAWLGGSISESLLLVLFACLMAFVAIRMWYQASRTGRKQAGKPDTAKEHFDLWSRQTGGLALLGFCTGILSGLFGVGGGFVIVPALVLLSDMPIHRAVATSLVVITLVSLAGVTSYLVAGRSLALLLTGMFVLGGVGGMTLGTWLSRRLAGPTLQKGFAVALVVVAVFMVTQHIV